MTQQFLCLSAADIHGNVTQYEKIKDLVVENNISFVFLCGDILPKNGGSWTPENKIRTIKMQADFINNYLLQYLAELGQITEVYAIFGNDDFKSNYHLVREADIPNVTFLDGKHFAIDRTDDPLTIQGDLRQLATLSDPRKTVYIFHEAPYGTPLDMIAPDINILKMAGCTSAVSPSGTLSKMNARL